VSLAHVSAFAGMRLTHVRAFATAWLTLWQSKTRDII
jgi:hypothetical protein